jgi:Domain of unknown function (DUF4202)
VADPRFEAAIAAIDAANAEDPNMVVVDGEPGPKELVHGRMMDAWVRRLDPDADDLALLAARAHHLRRWTSPRADHPDGRSGYLRWRTAARKRHASEVSDLLRSCGYHEDEIERVARIVRKENLGTDPVVQTHEDALCLVFLETQLDDLTEQLGADKTVDVLRKSIAKMGAAGLDAASGLELSELGRSVFERALSPVGPASAEPSGQTDSNGVL